jgi:hypothetical protein
MKENKILLKEGEIKEKTQQINYEHRKNVMNDDCSFFQDISKMASCIL